MMKIFSFCVETDELSFRPEQYLRNCTKKPTQELEEMAEMLRQILRRPTLKLATTHSINRALKHFKTVDISFVICSQEPHEFTRGTKLMFKPEEKPTLFNKELFSNHHSFYIFVYSCYSNVNCEHHLVHAKQLQC